MLVLTGLRLAFKIFPTIILFCKAYLGTKASFFSYLFSPVPSKNGVDLVFPKLYGKMRQCIMVLFYKHGHEGTLKHPYFAAAEHCLAC